MTGAQLIDEFLATGRLAPTRPRVLQFLNLRYEELLGLESWAFLEGKASVSLNSATVATPSDFGLARQVFVNVDGDPLDHLTVADFEDRYLGLTSSGRPEAFAVFADTLLIGPAPDTAYPATLLYTIDPIDLADDAVSPVTPSRTHPGLVAGAQAYALELENDPTGGPLEQRFQKTIDGMRRRYLTTGRGRRRAFARDPLAR